jgi:integrase
MHFHDLRHTRRTWLEEDKVQEVAIMRRLGHKLPGAPGVYRHLTAPMVWPMLQALQDRWEVGAAGIPALI